MSLLEPYPHRLHVIVRALSSSTCNSHCLIEKGNTACAKIIFSDYSTSHGLFSETNLKAMKTSKNQIENKF